MSDVKFQEWKEKLRKELEDMAAKGAKIDDMTLYIIGKLCKDTQQTSDPMLLRFGEQAKELFRLPFEVMEDAG